MTGGVLMDSIAKKLTEIEHAAEAIVQHAEAQKANLEKDFEEARRKFDEELEAKTQARIKKIREQLDKDTKNHLHTQAGENLHAIESLKKEYEEKHLIYAQEILKRITEV
jgi:uncharacterized protein YeaO (DUF488 family)